jgi:hypothetical protein
MWIQMLLNTNLEPMLFKFKYELNVFLIKSGYGYKKIIYACLVMSQLLNGININILI